MSAIKEIIDTVKDISKDTVARNNIRSELKDELRLNLDFLREVKTGKILKKDRMEQIIGNLEINELDAFLKCPFPKKLICSKNVTENTVKDINAHKLLRSGNEKPVDFEELCRRIRRMIRFIKKDFGAQKEPKRTLQYIRNYARVALKLLS